MLAESQEELGSPMVKIENRQAQIITGHWVIKKKFGYGLKCGTKESPLSDVHVVFQRAIAIFVTFANLSSNRYMDILYV